eukprot:19156-Amphidinium_carterae.1
MTTTFVGVPGIGVLLANVETELCISNVETLSVARRPETSRMGLGVAATNHCKSSIRNALVRDTVTVYV